MTTDDGKAQRPAVDPGDENTALELLVREHEDEDDDDDDGPTRQGGEDRRAHREKSADVGQHVREAGEHRERQSVLHATRRQKDEREDGHQKGREQLSADVCADDRLEVHHDAREPDVVRAGDDGEEPASEPIAVDHDVEREEEGAAPVRGDGEDAQREGERRRADGDRKRVDLEAAKPIRERGGQMERGESSPRVRACSAGSRSRSAATWETSGGIVRARTRSARMKKTVKTIAIPSPRLTPFSSSHRTLGLNVPATRRATTRTRRTGPEPDQQPYGCHDEYERHHGLER